MRRRAAAFRVALTASLLLLPGAAAAQGLAESLRTIVETNVSAISATTRDGTGNETRVESTNVLPRLTVTADTLLFPSLRLNLGGVFEFERVLSPDDDINPDISITRLRPFFELRSTDPVLQPGFSYFRRENRTRIGSAPSLDLVNEDYAVYFGWKPDLFPQSDFQYIRTYTYDGDRRFVDGVKDFGQVLSRYTYGDLSLDYQGNYIGTAEQVNGLETRQWSNAGRVDYGRSFLDRRLQWNATYNVNRVDLTTRAVGDSGQVALPVVPFAGLALVTDTPVTATLSPNPLLVDGNLAASAGIDLGLPALVSEAQPRNVGLDFLVPTRINRFLVWVDRELPADIARSFSWEVYSSPDNLIWTRESLVPVAAFGPFENRFQVDFPDVTARYVKLVTRPLSSAVLDASRYPDIFVTELQAFLSSSAAEAEGTQVRTTQNVNADVRLRLLDTPSLYYEGSYWYNGVDATTPGLPDTTVYRDSLSNGLSFTHRFNRVVSAYGRGAYEQGHQVEGDRTATVSNATLTVSPIDTLTTSFLYNGLDEDVGDLVNEQRNVSVQTNAQLYRGVDLQVGFGWNFATRLDGEDYRDRFLNVTASVVPRDDLNVTFNYVGSTTTRESQVAGDLEYYTRRGYLTIAYDPWRTLRLVLEEEVVAVPDQDTRITTNIGVNWAPFPDGSLQFYVAYDDALRPLEFGTERDVRVGVRWAISRQSYLDVSYQKLHGEFVQLTTDSRIFGVNLKLFF